MIDQMRIFMQEIKPALDELADFPDAEAAE